MRVLPPLIVVALLVAGAVFVADRPGQVALVWQGWRVDTSIAVLVIGTVVLAMVSALVFHLLRKVLGGPRAFMRARREKRRREGYRALTHGMVAVAAGDAEEAQKLARKADALLAEPPLTLLLSAQAAQLNGDEQAATKYFHAMLDRAETEFLGLRGLVMQALRGGDEGKALPLVERAKILRPRTPWVLTTLFELQARLGKWTLAEATLGEAVKRKALSPDSSRRHRAVLFYEKSRAAAAEGEVRDALNHAAKANGYDPSFVPGAVHYATLLKEHGRHRPAVKVIEHAWHANPHPALAEAHASLHADETPVQRLKHAERLTSGNPDHPESRLALAAAAFAAKLWGEARRHLDAAGAGTATGDHTPPPSPRVCRMMAELEEAQHNDLSASHTWLSRAAGTHTLDATYVCNSCGAESHEWHSVCPSCHGFNTFTWRRPGPRSPTARLPAGPGLAPALPLPDRASK